MSVLETTHGFAAVYAAGIESLGFPGTWATSMKEAKTIERFLCTGKRT